jgi:peroxiredoxin
MIRLAMLIALASCAPALVPATQWQSVSLPATSGATATYPKDLADAKLTVFVFFAHGCPCFGMHEARLRELVDKFGARGVRFVIVDSERGRTTADDAAEVQKRNLPVPVFIDPGAKLATMLGAVYATYSVVVDAHGDVQYRGGIDSDKSHLRDDRTQYLADALDDLTAGRAPRRAESKTLGCALQTW